MRGNVRHFLAAVLLLALTGCSLAPQYQRPASPVAESFAGRSMSEKTKAAAEGQADVAALGWRDVFTDPQLQQLIAMALRNNRDLRITALNVEEYQAQYRIRRAAQFPSIAGAGVASRGRSLAGDSYATSENYELELGTTAFELDFFGRVKNLKDQALEQYLAMEQTHRSAAISLVAEVANAYLGWLADRELLRISEETEKAEIESYTLVRQRVEAGIANELELAQARTSLESVRANLALYRRQVARDFHGLVLLTGAADDKELPIVVDAQFSEVVPIPVVPASLSSSVLLQRPDIVAAEHELKAANASIGAARASFFPTISLTATGGIASTELNHLFDGSSGTWLFAPAISVPLFTAGRLQAELDVATIREQASVARYEQAIQIAFREVADSLAGIATYDDQLQAQQADLTANEDYLRLARYRYEQGVDSFLTLLDAQRSLYRARQSFLIIKLAQLQNQVTLYKVLGGGWQETTAGAEGVAAGS